MHGAEDYDARSDEKYHSFNDGGTEMIPSLIQIPFNDFFGNRIAFAISDESIFGYDPKDAHGEFKAFPFHNFSLGTSGRGCQ